jgi:hypothetical protein
VLRTTFSRTVSVRLGSVPAPTGASALDVSSGDWTRRSFPVDVSRRIIGSAIDAVDPGSALGGGGAGGGAKATVLSAAASPAVLRWRLVSVFNRLVSDFPSLGACGLEGTLSAISVLLLVRQ